MTPQRWNTSGRISKQWILPLRYHSWILDLIRPYLGNNIVEVGAGTGSFSELLLQAEPERLTLIEPSAMFDVFAREFSVDHGTIRR